MTGMGCVQRALHMHLVSGKGVLAEGSVFNKEVHFADGAEWCLLAYRVLKQILVVIIVHRSLADKVIGSFVGRRYRWWRYQG